MRRILSYIKSHMYDIHAMIAAFVVVAIVMCIKGPIKNKAVLQLEKIPNRVYVTATEYRNWQQEVHGIKQ